MRAHPSRMDGSVYCAQASCMSAIHIFHWLGWLCSLTVTFPLVVVASMRARPSLCEVHSLMHPRPSITGQEETPIASMRARPFRTDGNGYWAQASSMCAVHTSPLVAVASTRAYPSRTDKSGYPAPFSSMCAVHPHSNICQWMRSLQCVHSHAPYGRCAHQLL
jgi:hypothetical protein